MSGVFSSFLVLAACIGVSADAATKPHIIFVMADDMGWGHFQLYDLRTDPEETRDLSGELPDRFEQMKRQLLAWNQSVDASFAGRDYPEGRLFPPDPEPQFWYDSAAYAPYWPLWKDRWEFRSHLERRQKAKKPAAKKPQ